MATQKDEISDWTETLRGSEQWMRNQVKNRWEKTLDQYRGRYYEHEVDDDQVAVNLVAGLSRLIMPTIHFANPQLVLSPTRPGTKSMVETTEQWLNYNHRELNTKKQIRDCGLDALIYGVGYMKMGWEVETEKNLQPVIDETTGLPIETNNGQPVFEDKNGAIYLEDNGKFVKRLDENGEIVPPGYSRPTLQEYIKREQPYAIRWSPWDFVKDPESNYADLSDARWIAFRMVKPLEEVKGHPLFKNTGGLEANLEARPHLKRIRNKSELRRDLDVERIELYEIWVQEWNKKTSEWEMHNKVMAVGHDRWLLDRKSPFVAEGFPVSVLTLTDDPESANPPSIFDFVQAQIETINQSRTQLARHRRRHDRRYVYNRNVIDEDEANLIVKSGDGAATGVDVPPDSDLQRLFMPIIDADLNPAVYDDYNLAFEEIQRILGVSDYQMAGQGPVRQATEANFIQSNFNVRVRDMQENIKEFFIDISKYWKQLYQQFGDFEAWLKVTGEGGEDDFRLFTIMDEIPDDLDWDADVSPSEFQSKQVERADAQALYNILRNDPMVNPAWLIERIAKAYGIQDVTRIFNQQAPAPEEPISSARGEGQIVDMNQFRSGVATDPGASGRAATGE